MNSYYNLFVGTENGLLKGINTQTRTFNNLNNLENLTKEKEILSLSWTNDLKQDEIYLATRDQHLVKYSTNHELEAPFEDLGQFEFGNGIIKGFEPISENKILTCVDTGAMKLWSINNENGSYSSKLEFELNVGSDICFIKKSRFNSNDSCLVATGGKENDLKIWDINKLSDLTISKSGEDDESKVKKEPVFRAKNLPDNWIQLREPVWTMCADFLDSNRIAVGTAYHQIRIYDIKSGVRRPVLSLNHGEHPITSIAVLPNDSNRLIAANTHGDLEMIDLRSGNGKDGKSKILRKYKGFQGTIKSIQISQQVNSSSSNSNGSNLCVASCGLDRFLRLHQVESGQSIAKIYLKSRLNCLLFSKYEPIKMPTSNNTSNKSTKSHLEDDQLSNINSEDLGTDDLWSDMETIIDEHPTIVLKRKVKERLNEFDSESDDNENENQTFKKPKKVSIKKSLKKQK